MILIELSLHLQMKNWRRKMSDENDKNDGTIKFKNNIVSFKKKETDDDKELKDMVDFVRSMADKLESGEVFSLAITYHMTDGSYGGDWYGDIRDIIYVNAVNTIMNIVDEHIE